MANGPEIQGKKTPESPMQSPCKGAARGVHRPFPMPSMAGRLYEKTTREPAAMK